MSQIEAIKRLCERELKDGVSSQNSWHYKHRNCAYIFVGNFESELSEGDLITAFSQVGEIVDIQLMRDDDGKSKGFCYIAFEDQRSTILAIDNFNSFHLVKRPLKVDHAPDFKPRRNFQGTERVKYEATGAEGKGLGVRQNIHEIKSEVKKE
jgi:RNA-binding motif X-linked protein 2